MLCPTSLPPSMLVTDTDQHVSLQHNHWQTEHPFNKTEKKHLIRRIDKNRVAGHVFQAANNEI